MVPLFMGTLDCRKDEKAVNNGKEDEGYKIDEHDVDTADSVLVVVKPNGAVDAQQDSRLGARSRRDLSGSESCSAHGQLAWRRRRSACKRGIARVIFARR